MKRLLAIVFAIVPLISQINGQSAGSWFSVKEVGTKVWQISDHGSDNMYVVEGRDSSLLIDTGLGVADLVSCVKKLTSKPLIIVNTHGHPDHAGSNYQFAKVYVHAADSADARRCNLPEVRANSGKNMVQGNAPSPDEQFKGKPLNTKLIPVKDGYIFHLGGRNIQVMEAPGHTPGEICLLDVENKYLFTGDNNNVLVWLFLPVCKPLHEYLVTLEKQVKRISEFTTLFPGHGDPMPSGFINDQIACVKAILAGTCEAKDYKSFAGNSKICTVGRASVAYNPNNL